uniref:Uncharacterized protein n=1 Tax=Tanacetum cinerariifolium TaxID=118510 RepID=A0A6L2LV81_TANCI|nr:hypothetical protein [Tanacetum cinerariifolium]
MWLTATADDDGEQRRTAGDVVDGNNKRRTAYLVEQCARKVASIRSPTRIGAGLGENIAPMERPDKIPLGIGARLRHGLLIGFEDGGWSPRPKPVPLPFLLVIDNLTSYTS